MIFIIFEKYLKKNGLFLVSSKAIDTLVIKSSR